jgi:hypothetical protein
MQSESLQQKIARQRRLKRWLRVRNQLRLRYYHYEDAGKLNKATALIQKITDRVIQPCRECGQPR